MSGFVRAVMDAVRESARRGLAFVVERNRLRLPPEPAPAHWPGLIDRHVPLARRLKTAQRERLLKLTQLLLEEVPFEGCGGIDMTDEIRVSIAATACVLLVNLPYPRFLRLRRVLVYPDTYVPITVESHHASMQQEERPLHGEAWGDGMVVLAWNRIRFDAENPHDAQNVVLHEFAHVLDWEDGYSDGIPVLDRGSVNEDWARVLSEEFARHHAAVAEDREAPLDDYAATNPAEFFAVATETFFESPRHLQEKLPGLYKQLSHFYRQDPAQP